MTTVCEDCGKVQEAVILDNNPLSLTSHLTYMEDPEGMGKRCVECWLERITEQSHKR